MFLIWFCSVLESLATSCEYNLADLQKKSSTIAWKNLYWQTNVIKYVLSIMIHWLDFKHSPFVLFKKNKTGFTLNSPVHRQITIQAPSVTKLSKNTFFIQLHPIKTTCNVKGDFIPSSTILQANRSVWSVVAKFTEREHVAAPWLPPWVIYRLASHRYVLCNSGFLEREPHRRLKRLDITTWTPCKYITRVWRSLVRI